MQRNNDFLGTEPIGRLLFKLSLPAVAAQLINMLYNVVDRIYIGHIPETGALALTGLGVCMPIIILVSAFAALVSMGGAPKASIAMGKGDNEGAERVLGNCFTLQICISLLLTAVLLLFKDKLLWAFGASENTIPYASAYLGIYALGTICVQLTLGMNAFISAQGFAKISMYTILIGAISNIVLDPVFIFLFNMGVRGAALATILSQAISAIWCICFLTGKRSILRIKRENLRLQRKVLLPCVTLGLAPFVMQASESVLGICFNASLLRYGGDVAVGAMTILNSAMQFTMLPMQGLGQGAQPISSYNYGAGNAARVRETFFKLLKVCLGYSLAMCALVMLFPGLFARIFSGDAALIQYTAWAIRIYFAGTFAMGAQIACQMTFLSIGNAKASITVAVLRKFILLIPLIYILPSLFENKAMAVYLAEPVSDILAVSFTVCLFAVEFKKAMKRLEAGPQA